MISVALKHNDCRNFVTVDVSKGICRRTGALVMIDTDVCPNFVALPKCKNCASYADSDEEHIGFCRAEKTEHWTYPELIAVTCTWYKRK